ncbi:unnamed protein product [Albugo candida]|uniref:Uncharacterized protein n=1 Tax=Albugo candida TaxID=65357 RepID=A0A024FXJ3_9STRA|nr:unnamed protein product [Albugo candida]|eukprot:CCI11746.1 unnamed protein product [Albugo candida]
MNSISTYIILSRDSVENVPIRKRLRYFSKRRNRREIYRMLETVYFLVTNSFLPFQISSSSHNRKSTINVHQKVTRENMSQTKLNVGAQKDDTSIDSMLSVHLRKHFMHLNLLYLLHIS